VVAGASHEMDDGRKEETMSGRCPWCLMTDQTHIPSEAQKKCRHVWHGRDEDPMNMRPLDAWGPPGGASYPLPQMPKTYSVDECIKMLANVGVDTTCGACMALAFTGSVIEPHTCKSTGGD
jgi:hypothetical protein